MRSDGRLSGLPLPSTAQPVRNEVAGPVGEFELAHRDRRRRHVDDDLVAIAAHGHRERVGAEFGPDAARRHDERPARREGHRDQPAVRSAPDPVTGVAEVVGAVHHADVGADLVGPVAGMVDERRHRDLPERVVGIPAAGGRRTVLDRRCGPRVDRPGCEPVDVHRYASDAVCVDAPPIGLDQVVDHLGDVLGGGVVCIEHGRCRSLDLLDAQPNEIGHGGGPACFWRAWEHIARQSIHIEWLTSAPEPSYRSPGLHRVRKAVR